MIFFADILLPKLTELAATLNRCFELDLAALHAEIQRDYANPATPVGQLARGIAMSELVEKVLQNQPHFLRQCWQQGVSLPDGESGIAELQQQLAGVDDEAAFYRVLRQFRYRELARLSLCQSLNFTTVETLFERLSQLAENLITAACDRLYRQACAEMGTPCDENGNPQRLYILGMGKLGGGELNFSSDIDLIFAYPAAGETQGGRRAVDNQKFFTRLGQRLINALDDFTADGFVYRTDMRLRPFGDSGALVLSFAALEQYYQDQGRDWERYAMIKGRILGADPQDPHVQQLYRLLKPFVYRRYIDFSAIQSLRDMKEKIEREVKRRGLANNIKLGAGGIRETEFIVQAFQLIRGGREIALQQPSLLKTLQNLTALGLLPPEQTEHLRRAYLFLRHTENLLQAIRDEQTQQLPDNPTDQARLIAGCRQFSIRRPLTGDSEIVHHDIQDWADFLNILHRHQQQVRAVFRRLAGDENGQGETDERWDFLATDRDELRQLLQPYGLNNEETEAALAQLSRFQTALGRRMIGNRGNDVLKQLLPKLFALIFTHARQAVLLPRILNIIEQIVSRTTYLELLLAQPQVLHRLIELCADSVLIAEQIARHPILLDELLNPDTLRSPLPYTEYRQALRQYLRRLPPDDDEQFIDALRQFKQSILLRVAAADILGALPVMKVSDHLTYLAEAVIDAVVRLAWKQVTARFGTPLGLAENETGFLVVGYGKLGGIELGYKSDLDLVFLYQNLPGQTQGGKKIIDNHQFYLRLAQKIVSIFSLNTAAGVLYDVDMRLRPSGEAGLLGCSLSAFENYQLNEAWTWEKQALVRARAVFGETPLRQQFDRIRQAVLSAPRDIGQLKTDIVAMRKKMYAHLSHTAVGEFNIKTDRGGITDIEFIAQYLMLAQAPHHPALTQWSDNVRIFDDMAANGLISQTDGEKLKQCYVELRNRIHHLNLQGQPSIVPAVEFAEPIRFITDYWHRLFHPENS